MKNRKSKLVRTSEAVLGQKTKGLQRQIKLAKQKNMEYITFNEALALIKKTFPFYTEWSLRKELRTSKVKVKQRKSGIRNGKLWIEKKSFLSHFKTK